MSQRSMVLSAFVAAFVLVVIGGVVATLTEPRRAELASAEPTATARPDEVPQRTDAVEPGAPGSPGESLLSEREAEYRRLIAEANRRLTEQQRALDAARRRVRAAEARTAEGAQANVETRFTRGEHERNERGDDDEHEHEDDGDDEEHEAWDDD